MQRSCIVRADAVGVHGGCCLLVKLGRYACLHRRKMTDCMGCRYVFYLAEE